MSEQPSARKATCVRPRPLHSAKMSEIADDFEDSGFVDASYGDTLRHQLPRRLSALTGTRRSAC